MSNEDSWIKDGWIGYADVAWKVQAFLCKQAEKPIQYNTTGSDSGEREAIRLEHRWWNETYHEFCETQQCFTDWPLLVRHTLDENIPGIMWVCRHKQINTTPNTTITTDWDLE